MGSARSPPLLPSQEDGLLAVHTSWTSISGCGKRRAEEPTDGQIILPGEKAQMQSEHSSSEKTGSRGREQARWRRLGVQLRRVPSSDWGRAGRTLERVETGEFRAKGGEERKMQRDGSKFSGNAQVFGQVITCPLPCRDNLP